MLPSHAQAFWRPSLLGGGGYVTGLLQDPLHPGRIFARSDVAGVFRSDDAGISWRAVNAGLTRGSDHAVRSFAIGPDGTLLRASGEPKRGLMTGRIHRSRDGGDSWHLVADGQVDYGGNCSDRMFGELLAIDPSDPAVMLAGSRSKGLLRSVDGGDTWSACGPSGLLLGTVVFHPRRLGLVLAGCLQYPRHQAYVGDPDRGQLGRILWSHDHGCTWHDAWRGRGEILRLAWGHDDDLILAGTSDGIRRFRDQGHALAIEPPVRGLPEDFGNYRMAEERDVPLDLPLRCQALCADPHRAGVWLAGIDRRPRHEQTPHWPLYRSVDDGVTWHQIAAEPPIAQLPAGLDNLALQGLAISDVLIDRHHPDRCYVSNWWGVIVGSEQSASWDAHRFTGIEVTCCQDVATDATGRVVVGLCDHKPIVSHDGGRTFGELMDGPVPGLIGDAACVLPLADGRVLFGLYRRGDLGSQLVLHAHGQCRLLREFPAGYQVHDLVQDSDGTCYALVAGPVAPLGGLWTSTDGISFTRCASAPGGLGALPMRRDWIERELLPVVSVQPRNTCGTNNRLVCLPGRPRHLHLAEWTEGCFSSADGGQTWRRSGVGLPYGDTPETTALCCTASDDGRIWIGFLHQGLFCSRDDGASFQPIAGVAGAVSCIACRGPLIAIASEPLHHAPAQDWSVRLSRDHGATWQTILTHEFGALRWKHLAFANDWTLVGVTCGNGIFCYSVPSPIAGA